MFFLRLLGSFRCYVAMSCLIGRYAFFSRSVVDPGLTPAITMGSGALCWSHSATDGFGDVCPKSKLAIHLKSQGRTPYATAFFPFWFCLYRSEDCTTAIHSECFNAPEVEKE